MPESLGSRDSGTFLDLQNSTWSTLTWQAKRLKTFSVRSCADICASRLQKGPHFELPVRVFTSGISQIWKKCQNTGILRILTLFSKLRNSTYRPCKVWAPRRQKRRHFSWPLKVITSGILQIWKKYQNPKYLRILAHFSDFQNFTFKYLSRPCKVFRLFPFFRPFLCRSIWVSWQEKWRHFAWTVKVLKSGIFQIWKKYQNPEIFRICHFFRFSKFQF